MEPSQILWIWILIIAKSLRVWDYEALKKIWEALMTDSQDWWPAVDYGHYGPFSSEWHGMLRAPIASAMAGEEPAKGLQRFAPWNSWPDNTNLDKARRLLWPIKQKIWKKKKYMGRSHDPMGNSTGINGFKPLVFPVVEPMFGNQMKPFIGTEKKWLDDATRYSGERDLENPLAAVQMGLIYVILKARGNPDPIAAAKDIRETFGRMAMDDETEETVALIAGGHTFGKDTWGR